MEMSGITDFNTYLKEKFHDVTAEDDEDKRSHHFSSSSYDDHRINFQHDLEEIKEIESE